MTNSRSSNAVGLLQGVLGNVAALLQSPLDPARGLSVQGCMAGNSTGGVEGLEISFSVSELQERTLGKSRYVIVQ